MNSLDLDTTRTDAMCAGDPKLAAIRDALLRVEAMANERGWDYDSNIGHLLEVSSTPGLWGQAELHIESAAAAFHDKMRELSDSPGESLAVLASTMETASRRLRENGTTGDIPVTANHDATFYGWALLTETWMVITPSDAEQPTGGLAGHPDRIEARMIQLVGRDGLHWTVLRQRGEATATVVVNPPESTSMDLCGRVPNALGRMTAAVVDNPVPIPVRSRQKNGKS